MAAILPFLPAIASAGSSLIGGLFGKKEKQETKIQKQQGQLVDQLIASLNGQGPYANLFQASEADFNKSFREPALANFRNRTAPQIQQSYIAGGQQRSTGLEDTLTRAGVDMDQILNQNWMSYVQGKERNQAGALNQILGLSPGAFPGQSGSSAAKQGVAGYLSGDTFGKDLESLLSSFRGNTSPQQTESINDTYRPLSKGFEQENQYYNPYTGVMG